jgi:hypothetical protein
VGDTDTPAIIEATYGVSWARVVAVNGQSPLVLLVPGTVLRIPSVRARGSQSIDGLPVLGSHVGQDAWGVDIAMELQADGSGDLLTVAGQDCLMQGLEVLVGQVANDLLDGIDVVSDPAKGLYLAKRLASAYMQDPRVKSATVDAVASTELAGAWDLTGKVNAINGLEIRTGGRL